MTASFGTRLDEVFVRSGRLCVGIDPHRFLLEAWGLPDTAAGAGAFGLAVVEAAAGRAGIVKPQAAFFERFGSAGYIALEGVLAAARDADPAEGEKARRGRPGPARSALCRHSRQTRKLYASITLTAWRWKPVHSRP